MAWYNPLSWGDKVIDNVLDKDSGLLAQVGGWVGNAQFTDEERAELNAKLGEKTVEFVGSTLSENSARSKTRRAVAVRWINVQLAMILIVMMVAPFDMELAKFYAEITFGTLMISGTLSIIAFFFGPYMIGSHMRRKAEKGN